MERLNQEDKTLIHIRHRHPLHITDLASDTAPPQCHACCFACTGLPVRAVPLRPAPVVRTVRPHDPPPVAPGARPNPALLLTPAGEYGCHLCRACRHIGYSWSFYCEPCGFDLHLPCTALPGAATAPAAHRHRLTLIYEDPRRDMGSFDFCVVCRKGYSTAMWFYACRECGLGGHVGCVVPDMLLRDEYAALDKEQTVVADAARWTEALLPESQQLEELLNEKANQHVIRQLDAGGLMH